MYESFYKLKKLPFDLLSYPDPLFMSKSHKETYSNLERALSETKEFVAITGGNGSGKTTLINHFLSNLKVKVRIGHIDGSDLIENFTQLICEKFQLDVEGKTSMGMLDFFHAFLLKQYEIKERIVIFIDDAHKLKPEAMEELWMISNLESETFHLIQVILVGKPEFEYLLRRKDLQKFAERITMRCHLEDLSMTEAGQYIRHRLKLAGAPNTDLFDEGAIKAIYRYSNGNPRLINILCDTALVDGFADSKEFITKTLIENVADENKGEGLFSDTEKKSQVENTRPQTKTSGSEPQVTLSSDIEERISRLESLAEGIDYKLDNLLKRKSSQDRTVVELNKMFMESLKRHGNTLKQFRSYKEKVSQEMKTAPSTPQEKAPRSGDPLKKKKRNLKKKISTTWSHPSGNPIPSHNLPD